MTDHLAQVKQQLQTLQQLESIMTAMRGIAAARLHDAHTHLAGINQYADTISDAIGQILALEEKLPSEPQNDTKRNRELIIVLTAEQGFAGAYNERIIDTASQHVDAATDAGIILVGNRGLMIVQNHKLEPIQTLPMVTRVESVATLGITLADIIYQHLGQGDYSSVSLIYPQHVTLDELLIEVTPIIPFDYSQFDIVRKQIPPLLTLEPNLLLRKLAEEYVFAMLCKALTTSHAVENEERVRAMVRARSNVEHTRFTLTRHFQQVRQEQITAEIAELSSGRISK